jgi:predicted nucleic acid-binding protein
MPAGRRRQILDAWLREALPLRFDERVLSIDGAVANAWGGVMARCAAAGRPIGVMDAFVAATTEVHGLTLVTRKAADFRTSVEAVANPWTGD